MLLTVWFSGVHAADAAPRHLARIDPASTADRRRRRHRAVPHRRSLSSLRPLKPARLPAPAPGVSWRMDSRQTKQSEALAALSAPDRARLERLAAMANMPPENLWPDVWLYGFEDVEEGIDADIQADKEIAAGLTISNDEVIEGIRRIIDQHVGRKRNGG